VSGASLGAAAGAILAGPTSDRFGRKTLLIVDAGIYATGAILSAVTPDAGVLLFARTLIGLAIGATVAGVEVTAIMTAVNVSSTYLGFRWIDKFGRRALAMGGYAGMIIFALVAALGLAFTSGTLRLVIIMIGLDFFIASFAVGVGGTGWTLQGEVFPTAVRGQAAAFCAMIDWLANFLLIEVFPVWQNAISLAGVLVCFAALAFLAIVFVYRFLPETKGLPVEDIVKLFERQTVTGPAPSAEDLPERGGARER
jgi:MFS family permease